MSLGDRIRDLPEVLGGVSNPAAAGAAMCEILADGEFVELETSDQLEFFESVRAYFANPDHFHRVALQVGGAISRHFAGFLGRDEIGFADAARLYDLQYLLYWCAANAFEEQREFDTHVVRPFASWISERFPERPVPALNRSGPIRLCYMAQYCNTGQGNALAPAARAVLRALTRSAGERMEFFLYAWMFGDDEFLEEIAGLGVTVRRFDLSFYDSEELERLRVSLQEDRVDVLVTDMNSAVPAWVFETRCAPVQVYYQFGMPWFGVSNVDLAILGWDIEPAALGFSPKRAVHVRLPWTDTSDRDTIDRDAVEAERGRFPADKRIIGFYGRLAKISEEYLEILRRVVERHDDTIVAIGGIGTTAPIDEFIARHQLADRVFVVGEFVDGLLWREFLEVFLDTFPLMGGNACVEVLAAGKPIVHMLSIDMPNLNEQRDPGLLARTADEYAARVSVLLDDREAYVAACAKARQICQEGREEDAVRFAGSIGAAIDRAVLRRRAVERPLFAPFYKFAEVLDRWRRPRSGVGG